QENVHGVAIDRRQLGFRRRLPAGGSEDLGKLSVGLRGPPFDLRGVRQAERLGRQAAARRQALAQLARVRPPAPDPKRNGDRAGWLLHLELLRRSAPHHAQRPPRERDRELILPIHAFVVSSRAPFVLAILIQRAG